MAIVNLKELLADAKQKKYAVLATNPPFFHFAEIVVSAAIEKKSPVIIQISDGLEKYFNYSKLMKPLLSLAEDAPVPVVVSLDHGFSFETVMMAIKAGCTSVMFDGSRKPLDENINMTKEIVKIAHSLNVSVEGEVGVVSGLECDFNAPAKVVDCYKSSTVPDVKRFVGETGVDAVAVSVGNAHGVGKDPIKIDYEMISDIRAAVEIPLVFHGGSGLPDDVFKKVIENGICKINYYTDLIFSASAEIRKVLTDNPDFNCYPEIISYAMQSVKRRVIRMIDLIGSGGRYI